ncbi:MAG: hypothetical protein M0024_06475 [Nitrospiraceae bacterium]|nr:hypothetical protein [Nitrospiraceae bacterium]
MEDDVLSKVVAVEKEIQQRLELERTNAREWLEKTRAEQERKFLEEKTGIEKESDSLYGQAVKDAEARAAEMLDEAREEAARLEKEDDEVLARIVMKHIVGILPGKAS